MKAKKAYRFFSLLLFSLFIAYQATVIVYTHIHVVSGVLIVHIHPFQKKSDTTHQHTVQDFATSDLLTYHHALSTVFTIQKLTFHVTDIINQFSPEKNISVLHTVLHFRGPPAIV